MPTGKPATEPSTALVIGGGIVGLSCALALARRGMGVTLVAPRIMRGTASWGNAGHIAVEQVMPLASLATVRSLPRRLRSEEHTSELQSLMRISYAVFCLKQKLRHTQILLRYNLNKNCK